MDSSKSSSVKRKIASCLQQICRHYHCCMWMLKSCIMNDEFFQRDVHQSSGEMHCVIFRPEHWTINWKNGALNYKPAICGTFELVYLRISTTSIAHFGAVSPMFSTRYGHTKLRCWISLDISTFGESRCTRPTLTLIYLIYNTPLNVWNTYFGSVYQKFWQ